MIEFKECKISGCVNRVHARGYCAKHLMQLYRNGGLQTIHKNGYSKRHKIEYSIWKGVKSRCYCKTSTNYSDYGGRGIKMSDEWKNDFLKFYADMGPRPGPDYEIDRVDSSGNYCKENCKWVLRAHNRKKLKFKAIHAKSDPVNEWLSKQRETIKPHYY